MRSANVVFDVRADATLLPVNRVFDVGADLFFLMDMFSVSYDGVGVDLGTHPRLRAWQGIVIRRPSVVAIDKNDRRILAVGIGAKRMLGRTPHLTSSPSARSKDGVITRLRCDRGHAALLHRQGE